MSFGLNFARIFEGMDPEDFEVRVKDSELDKLLGRFFHASNLQPKDVLNEDFEKFLELLDKIKFHYRLPARQTLAGSILKKVNDNCENETRKKFNFIPDCTLMVNTWTNEAAKKEYIIFTMSKANVTTRVFLSFKNISLENETAETLSTIIQEAINLAWSSYKSKVCAVVTPDDEKLIAAAGLTKTIEGGELLLSTCSSSRAKSLMKYFISDEQLKKVKDVINLFQRPQFKSLARAQGPMSITYFTYSDTRLFRLGTACQCILTDFHKLQAICQRTDIKVDKDVRNVRKILSDPEFEKWLQQAIPYLNPICELVKTCQQCNCDLAGAMKAWLSLKFPRKAYRHEIQQVMKKADENGTSHVGYLAYYLHPLYFKRTPLNDDQMQIVNDYLTRHFPGALEELSRYLPKIETYRIDWRALGVPDPESHWGCLDYEYPVLSKCARKIYRMPASIAYSEEIFASCTNVHSVFNNRILDEKANYLLNIYFSMQSNTYPSLSS